MPAVEEQGLGCFEYAIAAIAKTLHHNHIPLFADTWGFHYIPVSRRTDQRIGTGIADTFTHLLLSLSQYAGIVLKRIEYAAYEEWFQRIQQQLFAHLPVFCIIDLYECHWTPWYRKFHRAHYILIVGLESDGSVLTLDPMYRVTTRQYPRRLFPFIQETSVILRVPFEPLVDLVSLAATNIDRLWDLSDGANSFDHIRRFAQDIGMMTSIVNEIEPSSINNSPLFFNLHHTAQNREKFAHVLTDPLIHSRIPKEAAFASELRQLAKQWRNIEHLLLKTAYQTGNANKFSAVANKIAGIADAEEQLAQSMRDYFNTRGG